ncbi:TfoX/Sxy family protein [Pseudokineococcus marinus]|uniref:RNA methyltransferase n=1 Tax=Pseudokineococcus marinus TaxID=351215 RepID=A0A849BV49_9ACTN|nr:TfoX/Sxy family protein [Pseudokineococcus marinus]NNH23376.1 RNA methyltransferase [Pseudokineococcus marinus]
MAYDEDLAERVREALAAERDRAEKAMFGGLAVLLGGRMAVAVSGSGGLMVRVDPDEALGLLERPDVGPVVMRDRPTRGWVLVAPAALTDDDELRGWVERGAREARRAAPPARGRRPRGGGQR